tara:strand:- start:137 stop:529 length:393 start_codon:yes stop_codon:yes gene_type:complete
MKRKVLIIIFGFVMWPIAIATPYVVSAYMNKVLLSEINIGEMPQPELMLGLFSGLFAAILVMLVSFAIAFVVSQFRESSISGLKVFFVITCLYSLLLIIRYSDKVYTIITADKDHIENIQKRIQEELNDD